MNFINDFRAYLLLTYIFFAFSVLLSRDLSITLIAGEILFGIVTIIQFQKALFRRLKNDK